MDELDEILHKEEELYDDVITPEDKQSHRHPLFIILAVIALIAVIFFAIHFFLLYYPGWRAETENAKSRSSVVMIEEISIC